MQHTIDDLFEIVETLREVGMTDPAKHPYIYHAIKLYINHGIRKPFVDLLNNNPKLLEIAKRKKASLDLAKKYNPFLPAPYNKALEEINGAYLLGYVNKELNTAGIDRLDFTQGLFVCGSTGSGKTYFMLSVLDQMLRLSPEERGFNIIIVQIAKRDADFLAKRYKSLKILEWEDLRYNMWEAEPWENIKIKLNYSRNIFSSVNYFLGSSRPLLETAMNRALDKYKTLENLKIFPTFSDLLEQLEPATKQLKIGTFKSQEVMEYLTLRFTDFINTGEIMNCRNGLTIEDFWSKEDVVLNIIDEQNDFIYRTFFIDMLMALQRYHSLNEMRPPRLKTLIVVDECRTLFKATHDRDDLKPDKYIERVTTTGRASGIGWMSGTQEPQNITTWITDNAKLFFLFPISGTALEKIHLSMNMSEDQVNYVFKLPPQGKCIVRDRRRSTPYILEVPGTLQVDEFPVKESKQYSREYFQEIHEQLAAKSETQTEEKLMSFEDLTNAEQRVLNALVVNPFLSFTELRNATKLADRLRDVMMSLEHVKLIETNVFEGGKGQPATYFALTEKAQEVMKIPNEARISPRLFMHTLYEEWVCQYLRADNLQAIKEFTFDGMEAMNFSENDGSQEIIKTRIDVYCPDTKTAYEITRDDVRHLHLNVYKCFSHFEDYVDRLVIVCENSDVMESAMNHVDEYYSDERFKLTTDRIEYVLVREMRPKK